MKHFNLNPKACAVALGIAALCITLPVSAQSSSPIPDSTAPNTTIVPDNGTSGITTTTTDSNDGFDLGWLGLLGLFGLAGLVRKPQEQRRSGNYVDPVTPTTTRSDYNR
jgi:MYXO-CTERM domain-containing protein